MRAVKDSLAASLRAKWGKSEDLRWMCAGGDYSGYPFRSNASELGGSICISNDAEPRKWWYSDSWVG